MTSRSKSNVLGFQQNAHSSLQSYLSAPPLPIPNFFLFLVLCYKKRILLTYKDGTRMKELMDMQKKQELWLMEEKSKRQVHEQQVQAQFENMMGIQAGLQNSYSELVDSQKTIQLQLQGLLDQMQHLNRGKSVLGEAPVPPKERTPSSRPDSEFSGSQGCFPPISSIEFPRFNGDEPRGWIRKCQWYFQTVYTIPEDQRVSLASIHLSGRAELWFQGLVEKGLPSWQEFIEAVYERFEGRDPGAVLGEFNTLQQGTKSVEQYLENFEELKSHVMVFHSNFPESYYVTCFINGLRPDIKGQVISLRPTRLHQAVALAKNQENTVNAILQLANPNTKPWPHSKQFSAPKPTSNPLPPKLYHPPPKPMSRKMTTQAPIRRILSEAEMQARRSKNLCYNCDETFRPGHKCKQQFMYCILTEEEATFEQEEEGDPTDPPPIDMTVSVNALSGNTDFYTFRIKGRAYGHEIQILIDGVSTHCFLDIEAASKLGCVLEQTDPLVVSVADGREMISQWYCPTFSWEIQGQAFTHPMRTLTLGGCHMVLGGNWLRLYSPVEYDYNAMTVTVSQNGKKRGFQALTQKAELHMLSAKHISKMVTEDSYGFVGQLYAISVHPPLHNKLNSQQKDLSNLLAAFTDLFQEPQGLPPNREIEHKILLKQDAVPKKMHPYRYSFAQKGEIEAIVKGMLKDGIIRPSQSAFGSPVLLVKKKMEHGACVWTIDI
ncbi:uncharacterized protein LOC110011314 [Sesamum indicum]|uniref:Uncharacterized protein LOC110011314 n=1 Tax=Sesamum indicum TaxID=4182 RepID=A0A8M8USW1_SESIN|nr:uncharacterized protein LOC110011314 [Sesamum indicum]